MGLKLRALALSRPLFRSRRTGRGQAALAASSGLRAGFRRGHRSATRLGHTNSPPGILDLTGLMANCA